MSERGDFPNLTEQLKEKKALYESTKAAYDSAKEKDDFVEYDLSLGIAFQSAALDYCYALQDSHRAAWDRLLAAATRSFNTLARPNYGRRGSLT